MPFTPSTAKSESAPMSNANVQKQTMRGFGDPAIDEAQETDVQTQLDHAMQFGHGVSPSIQRQTEPSLEEDEEKLQRQTEPGLEEEDEELPVQAKLTIGQPGDKYEQEADQMAAKVMRMPEPEMAKPDNQVGAGLVPAQLQEKPSIQREVMPEEEKEEALQAKPQVQAKGGTPTVPENFEGQLASHRGGGQPLSDETRAFMEPRFGMDFSDVRVHETPDLTNAIQAQAFTHGQDIYFNSGKYNPGSSGGKELLAHELTHVVQQRHEAVYRQLKKKSSHQNFWEWYGSGERNGGQAYLALRTELERRGFSFLTRISVGNETDGSFLWQKGFPDRNTFANEVAWSIKLSSGNWSWATVKTIVPKCQKWLSLELMQDLANGRSTLVAQIDAAESDHDRRTKMERLHSYDVSILNRLRRLTNNIIDRWHHPDPKVQDAVLAALQLDAVFNAESDLDLPTAEAHTAAYQDAQMTSTHDWCGFFAARQYVRSNLDRDLRKGLFHVNNVEDYFNYNYERSNRIKKWIYVENSWKEIKDYHRSRGSNRKWLNHQEVQVSGLDIRSGDIVVLDHQGDGTGDHIVMAHSWDPLTNILITIGGNDSGYQIVSNSSQSNLNTQDTERQRLEDSTGRSLRPGNNGGHVGVRIVRPEVQVHGIGRPSIIDFEDHIYSQRNSSNAPD